MHPIARTCLAFVVGVALAPFVPGSLLAWSAAALVLVPLTLCRADGLAGLAVATALGVVCCRAVPDGPALEGDVVVLGVREGASSGRDGHLRVLRSRAVGGEWTPAEGRIQVHWPDAPPPSGAEVLVFGTASSTATQRLPGAPDPTRAMHRVQIHAQLRARRVRVLGAPTPKPHAPRDPTGLLTALALGDRSGLDPHTVEVLRATGTAHLLAISGFHVGVVAMLAAGLAARLRKAWGLLGHRGLPRLELVAAIGAAFAYAAVAGAPLSAQRAAGLLALGALGRLAGRGVAIEAVLGLVAVGVLWIDPAAIATPSFQPPPGGSRTWRCSPPSPTWWRCRSPAWCSSPPQASPPSPLPRWPPSPTRWGAAPPSCWCGCWSRW